MRKMYAMIGLLFGMVLLMSNSGCESQPGRDTETNSGVKKATVNINTDANGNTVEQKNVGNRIMNDNKPGAIKHLYVISPYSGQTILYSTVQGKVTSSGKRLQPKAVEGNGFRYNSSDYDDNVINIGRKSFMTNEVIQDDGTYGDSDPYIYWWDVRGIYHQHFMTGGQIIHVSDQPLNIKSVIINIEALASNEK